MSVSTLLKNKAPLWTNRSILNKDKNKKSKLQMLKIFVTTLDLSDRFGNQLKINYFSSSTDYSKPFFTDFFFGCLFI